MNFLGPLERYAFHLKQIVGIQDEESFIRKGGRVLSLAIQNVNVKYMRPWLEEQASASTSFSVPLFKLLGEITPPYLPSWRAGLVERALTSRNKALREVALEVAEVWNDEELLPVLQNHIDRDDDLDRYTQRIANALEERYLVTYS